MSTDAVAAFDDPATLTRFADLVVGFAANVQRGQVVSIGSEIGKEFSTEEIDALLDPNSFN